MHSANTFQQGSNTSAEPQGLGWDARAEAFALAAYRAGKPGVEISRQLHINGYKPFKPEIIASLQRQGVQNVDWDPVFVPADPAVRTWDAQADAFLIDAHRAGQGAAQISTQLNKNGYVTTPAKVASMLHGLGAHRVYLDPFPATRFPWNAQADTFALAAHHAGKTVPQITAQLSTNGYAATIASVTASLNKQGVVLKTHGP